MKVVLYFASRDRDFRVKVKFNDSSLKTAVKRQQFKDSSLKTAV